MRPHPINAARYVFPIAHSLFYFYCTIQKDRMICYDDNEKITATQKQKKLSTYAQQCASRIIYEIHHRL
jgi:hypothetical protein